MSLYQLHIKNPCGESWYKMKPVEGGRFCRACSKTVTDFSAMTDEAVKEHFRNYSGAGVCGRFKTRQLNGIRVEIPKYVLRNRMPLWQKYLLALLLCFGSALMPADFVLSTSQKAHAQTREVMVLKATKKAAKKKRKKTRRHRIKIIEIPIGDFTFGLIGYEPQKESFPFRLPVQPVTPLDPSPASAQVKETGSSEQQHKKEPPKKSNHSKLSFLPPASTRIRRRKLPLKDPTPDLKQH
jgi:hypothetical protein